MNDPHDKDFCVVCGRKTTVDGPVMHPVNSIQNGYVCENCTEDPISIMNVDEKNSILEEINFFGEFNLPINTEG